MLDATMRDFAEEVAIIADGYVCHVTPDERAFVVADGREIMIVGPKFGPDWQKRNMGVIELYRRAGIYAFPPATLCL